MHINIHNVTHIAIDEINEQASSTCHRTLRIFTSDGEQTDIDLFACGRVELEPVKVTSCIAVTEKDIENAR